MAINRREVLELGPDSFWDKNKKKNLNNGTQKI
jgi:hypothetical protein